jgi:autotransporter-associated beta strand protein
LGPVYCTDKLGGPSGNWNGEVHGTITHASDIDLEHPFELVGKGTTLKLDGTGLENLPLTISGTGNFNFIGNRTNITDTAISFTGEATYQQSGNFYVRGEEGAMPVTTISGSGTVKTTGDLCAGYEGRNGEIKITDGAKVNVGGFLKIGCNLNGDSRPAVKGKMSIENATVTVSDIIYMGSNCSNGGEDRETLMNEIVLSKRATLCMGNRFVRFDDPRSRIMFNGGALTAQFSHTEFFYSGQEGIFEVEAANGNDIKLNIGSYSIGATCNHTHFFGTGGLDIQGKAGSSAKFTLGKAGLTDFSVEYSGDTKITDATLVLGVPLPSGGKIIGAQGTLQLDNVTITNKFEGDIKVTGNGAIVVGADGKDCILDVPVDGPTVIKVGAGTLTLSNNFNGKLVVKEGSVNVRGIAYKSYRFKIEGIRGPNPDAVQLSELKLFDGKNDVTRPYSKLEYDSNGAVANNIYPAKESPNNIVDGSTSTKWLDWRLLQSHPESDHDRVWLRIDYPSLRQITGYAWYTANDFPIRDPSAWRLQGSNDDGVTWEDIDIQTGYAATESRNALAGTFNNLGALGSSGRIVVESGGKLRVIAGAISSAAIINEGGEVELSQGASIVSEGGILDGGVSGSGSVDVIGGSVALKGEQSYKGTTHVKSGTLSIGVAANTAERVSFNGKYFRLTLKRSNNNGARLDYKNGNKVANGAGAMQASEFQLYDANGNNVAKGLSKVAEGTSATSLAPGKFAPAAVYTYGANEGADKLFDGDTGTKCNMTVPVSRNNSSTWRVFTMRLADTAEPVVSYNFYTANDYVRRSPTDWKLEGSKDGIVWETLDERFFAPNAAWSTITKATAYNEPTLVKKPFNNGTPFKFQERIQQPEVGGKFFRFTFKKTHGTDILQLSELQLLDADGNNVASGLVKSANELVAGTFVDGGIYGYGNNEGSDKLFDNNPDTKMCAINNSMDGAVEKYRVFTLRLPDNAAPVCGYNFVTANDFPSGRSPAAWIVEGSDDGETWTLLDERTDVEQPFSVYTSINHGKPYAFTQKIEKGEIPGDSFVIVDGGATLRLDDPNATIGALRIDCAAGAGAIEWFHPAARGKIELINVSDDFLCSNYIVPIDIKGVKNITNLNTWVVTINGKLSNVRARYRNGSIILLHAGLTVTIR